MDDELSSENQRLAAFMVEQFENQLAKVVENIDSRIAHQLAPIAGSVQRLETDMATVKLALKETNKQVQSLDKAMGNVEHRLHTMSDIVTTDFLRRVRTDRTLLHDVDNRVTKLESTA